MRAVTTATAAAVLGIKRKALDNMLGRLDSPEIPRGKQGVERRIPMSMLADLFIATEIASRLGVPARESFELAKRLASAGEGALGPFLQIQVDRDALQAELNAQLAIAIESVVRKPRGRPRRS